MSFAHHICSGCGDFSPAAIAYMKLTGLPGLYWTHLKMSFGFVYERLGSPHESGNMYE